MNPAHENNDMLACIEIFTSDWNSVIDFGCGFGYHLRHCKNARTRIGIDAHMPYLVTAIKDYAEGNIFLCGDVLQICHFLIPKSVDGFLLLDFIEHLPKSLGIQLLNFLKCIARKGIIIYTPDGFYPQNSDVYGLGADELQTHKSGWKSTDLEVLGFDVAVWPDHHKSKNLGALFATWTYKEPQA